MHLADYSRVMATRMKLEIKTSQREDGKWVASVEELDLSVEADTEAAAKEALAEKLKSPAALTPRLKTIFDEPEEGEAPPEEKKKPRIPIAKLFGVTASAWRLVWETARFEGLLVLALRGVVGLALPAQVAVGKFAMDAILASIRTGAPMARALPFVAALLGIRLVSSMTMTFSTERERVLAESVSRNSQYKLMEKALSLDLEAFETPSFYDQLHRGQQEASIRPWLLVMNLTGFVTSGITVLAFMVYLFGLEPILVPIILIAYIPLWFANVLGSQSRFMFRVLNTPKDRRMNYLSGVLTQLETAKEVRAFSLGEYLLGRYKVLSDERIEEVKKLARKNVRRQLAANVGTSFLSAAGLALLVFMNVSGAMNLSETAAALAALLLMSQRIGFAMSSANQLYESALFIEDFWSFLELKPKQITATSSARVPNDFTKVSLDDVTFTYPEQEQPALRNVSLEIPRGKTVALVGENGSGKTTTAKLLCRLYDPDSGTVSWDGRDLRTCDPEELRKSIAVIFQDFAQYKLTARENIAFGDVEHLDDMERVIRSAKLAGANEFIESLPEGYEAMLGRLFSQGHELSIGQWQRMALARAFFREAPLVIMDEPTASLDARSEYELFKTMRDLFQGRTVLLISHRFSSVRMADLIYVLKDGEVIEQGDHDELMKLDGLYAELFTLQASAYLS